MTRTTTLNQPTPLPVLFAGGRQRRAPQGLWTRLFIALQRWRYHARMRRELLTLDDRLLQDIGMSRADVETAVNTPFWRVWSNHELRHLL